MKIRLVKSLYMGFILDRTANDYLGNEAHLKKADILAFATNFNEVTDVAFNKIKIKFLDTKYAKGMRVKTMGDIVVFSEPEVQEIISRLEKLINDNLKKAITSGKYIDVFDLNTLDLLDRFTYNTMGDLYLASNRKRYMVNFIWLYSVADQY